MPERSDTCRDVTLPSGETICVRGAEPMGPEAVAALDMVVAAARARMAAEHPPDPAAEALWARLRAALGDRGIGLRDAAREAGVRFSTLFRIGQGYTPGEGDLSAVEAWLERRAAKKPANTRPPKLEVAS